MRPAECHPDRKHQAKGLCGSCYITAYNAANAERIRAYMRDHYHRTREQRKTYARAKHLREKYGVDEAWVEARAAALDNACAICRRPFRRVPHVDHNHRTGQPRDLLCAGCNTLVGNLEHPLRPAAEAYLEVHA